MFRVILLEVLTQKIIPKLQVFLSPCHNHCTQINIQNKGRMFSQNERDLVDLSDPDTFGSMSGQFANKIAKPDQGDIEEEKHTEYKPFKHDMLTTKQYADIIKQHLKHRQLKEALNVLEVKIIQEDRVKPENYIYNILIGGCAELGYTHKAFKLYNDMKSRALKPTGATYTSLFEACANSPFPADGLKRANHLRQLLKEKGIEPNITNYNVMIKAFGRCGDLTTAFELVDEMIAKKIKIRVHTLNFLLQSCITDKQNGLRHALIVWRKMLKLREKPNIYSFNLMLKCVRECNFASQDELNQLIDALKADIALEQNNPPRLLPQAIPTPSRLEDSILIDNKIDNYQSSQQDKSNDPIEEYNLNMNNAAVANNEIVRLHEHDVKMSSDFLNNSNQTTQLGTIPKISNATTKFSIVVPKENASPNLLSKIPNLTELLSLTLVEKPEDKFQLIGGLNGFLKEMEIYNVKPINKTFAQIIPLIDQTLDAEKELIDIMKKYEIKEDIAFYNSLIKKRCLRFDYENAFAVMDMIEKESKFRQKRYKYNKKLRLKPDILTYGILAMACKTKVEAEKLISLMQDQKLKLNIEIFGTMLRQATSHFDFAYVLYVINRVKDENLKINDVFLNHLKQFNATCTKELEKPGRKKFSKSFENIFNHYIEIYNRWLENVDLTDVTEPDHPWYQFKEAQPVTFQRQNLIEMPKRYLKRKRKNVKSEYR